MIASFTARDEAFMARALELAARGSNTTTPNPRVGCVLTLGEAVIGEGFHQRAGGPHAEIAAIADARRMGRNTRGATAYVTLEPCNHFGRTGPCTEALLEAGVARVIAAMHDPHPAAARGLARLRAAGIDTSVGLLEREAQALNRGFVSRVTRGRPWVRVKVAASLDGRTALLDGTSRWITGEVAREDGQRFRAAACAILTGSGTVVNDDPQLNVRALETPRQPRRIVIDGQARIPAQARVMAGEGALVVTAGPRSPEWSADVEWLALPGMDGHVDLTALMQELGRRQMNELHVEAGAGLNGALFAQGLVDEVLLYLAPCFIGDPARGIAAMPAVPARLDDRVELNVESVTMIGADWRVRAVVRQGGR